MTIDHQNDLDLPIRLPLGIRMNSARVIAEGVFQPTILEKKLGAALTEITGVRAEEFPLSTRVFACDHWADDSVVLQTVGDGLPLIVRRDGELVVNFDIQATQVFRQYLSYIKACPDIWFATAGELFRYWTGVRP